MLRVARAACCSVLLGGFVGCQPDESLDEIRSLVDDGFYVEAAERARRVLAEPVAGRELETARVLDLLAEALRRGAGRRDPEARRAAERALELKRRAGAPPEEVAQSLHNLGALALVTRRWDEADAILTEAARTWPAGEAGAAATSMYLAYLALRRRAFDAARDHLRDAADVHRATGTDRSADAAERLHYEALLFQGRGEPDAAEERLLRAIEVREACLRPGHPMSGKSWYNLALLRQARGDFAGALDAARRMLGHYAAAPDPDRRMWARSHLLAAGLALRLGAPGEAEAHACDALDRLGQSESAGAPDPLLVAQCWSVRTDVAMQERRFADARDHLERQRTVLEAVHADPRALRGCRIDAAYLTWVRGDLDGALAAYEAVLRETESDAQAEPTARVTPLLALGVLRTAVGDVEAAEEAFRTAVAIAARAHGPTHPSTVRTRVLLARFLRDRGEPERAFDAALEAEQLERVHVRETAITLPERRGLDYAGARVRGLDLALTLLGEADVDPPRAFDALVRGRSLVLDVQRELLRVAAMEPELADERERLLEARRSLARLAVALAADRRPSGAERALEAAKAEREAAEQALAKASAAFRNARELSGVGSADVLAALPDGAALLAFTRYEHCRRVGPTERADGSRLVLHYGAFVVADGATAPQWHPLGPADRIDRLVEGWRQSLAAGVDATREAGAALRAAIWDPLAAAVADADLVFVVSDGELHRVNLQALPAGDDAWLVETAPPIQLLTAERDLVEFARAVPARAGVLVVVGDPDVDAGVADGSAVRQFGRLPGAAAESAAIAELWSRVRDGASPPVVLSAAAATESAVKAQLTGAEVLHVAAHGYFRGPVDLGARTRSRRPRHREKPAAVARTPLVSDAPLLRSGLVLAGGNGPSPADPTADDGILTAEEILGLDLRGLRWVVLSACDTGLGEVRTGEGVLGLRRAFLLAGARTVVTSLWPVDDRATRDWMSRLYALRFEGRLETARAMRQASVKWLAAQRAAGEPTHPRLWAPFVAVGDWR